MVLKPMIKQRNFLKEIQFYEDVMALGAHSPQSPAAFLPRYFGACVHRTKSNARGSSCNAYVVIENIIEGYRKPCVLDLKIGRQTFEPSATEEKKKRNINKYIYQEEIGFRITGFKKYDFVSNDYVSEAKAYGRSLKPDQVTGRWYTFSCTRPYSTRFYLSSPLPSFPFLIIVIYVCLPHFLFEIICD